MLLAVLIMGAMGLVGYVAAKGLGLDGKYLRAFLMVVMFSNGGNYGLPVVTFVFGPEALTYATIFFLTGSLMTCVAGAFFVGSQRGKIGLRPSRHPMPGCKPGFLGETPSEIDGLWAQISVVNVAETTLFTGQS
jgi:predicted permease